MKKDNTKKEVFIAIFVAIFMILICIFIFVNSKNDVKKYSEIKVYKLIMNGDDKKDYYYQECSIDTEAKMIISENFNKINKLSESKLLTGVGINGNYKVVVDDEFFAFDNEENKNVYIGSQNKIYSYETDLYKKVIDWCE